MNLKSIKSVTVYCSSSNNVNKKFFKLAKDLGVFLAYKNIRIIYGGGSSGLMGTVSRNAILNGGKVTGIIPDFLVSKENINYKISKIIVVKSMSVRKKLLFNNGDAFIALPGGPGTLEEIVEIISWHNLNLHSKPIILINYNNYWQPLLNMYKNFYKKKFMENKLQSIFYSVKTLNELKKLF